MKKPAIKTIVLPQADMDVHKNWKNSLLLEKLQTILGLAYSFNISFEKSFSPSPMAVEAYRIKDFLYESVIITRTTLATLFGLKKPDSWRMEGQFVDLLGLLHSCKKAINGFRLLQEKFSYDQERFRLARPMMESDLKRIDLELETLEWYLFAVINGLEPLTGTIPMTMGAGWKLLLPLGEHSVWNGKEDGFLSTMPQELLYVGPNGSFLMEVQTFENISITM